MIAVAWVIFLDVVYCVPTAMPVTLENMNYVSVVSVGLTVFVLGLWFTTKRGKFHGPSVDLDMLQARRLAALHDDYVLEGKDVVSVDPGKDILSKSVSKH